MKNIAIALVTALLGALVMVALVSTADAKPGQEVCGPLDSGKIDTSGDPASVTVTAPAGKLINGYCVKAGSTRSGAGVEYVRVNPAQKTVVISHSSGKDVSHYSVSYVETEVTTTTTTVTIPETTTTTVPETTTTTVADSTTTTVPDTVVTSSTTLKRSEPAEPVPAQPQFTG